MFGIPREQLTQILENHVVRGNLESGDIVEGPLRTLHKGGNIDIAVDESTNSIGVSAPASSARVTATDLDNVCNGAIHQIDSVLLPFTGDELGEG